MYNLYAEYSCLVESLPFRKFEISELDNEAYTFHNLTTAHVVSKGKQRGS